MDLHLQWWIWMIGGFALLALELASPGGFYVFFFGIGAVLVGILSGLGIAGPGWMEWLLFGGISVLSLVLFRRPLREKVDAVQDHQIDSLVGQVAVAMAAIEVHKLGEAELRGTRWNARNTGAAAIQEGQRCEVTKVDGLRLDIRGLDE